MYLLSAFLVELILLLVNNKAKIAIISVILSICLFCYFEFSDKLESFVLNKFKFNHKKVVSFFDESSELAAALSVSFMFIASFMIIFYLFALAAAAL